MPDATLAETSGTRQPSASERPWRQTGARPFIMLRGVTKRFGEFVAVDRVDLEIFRGELFCLLGGSGCGKTTLLRMLAGFETPSAGQILIDGQDMAGVPPEHRPTNMMFQSYALFPHMTVARNVGYGLRREGLPRAEVEARVSDMLRMVKLEALAHRKPHQLSGGQKQRVALARALVKRPKVLLLDEPLGALDKKLREETQFELIRIQETLGITFVVVTHDQDEAMTLATRIGVMRDGKIVQVGEPREIYEYPNSRFVADFIGSVNLFEGRVAYAAPDGLKVETPELGAVVAPVRAGLSHGQMIWLAIRPERVWMTRQAPIEAVNTRRGVIEEIGYVGHSSTFLVRLESGRLVRVTEANEGRRNTPFGWDETVYLSFDPDDFRVLTE